MRRRELLRNCGLAGIGVWLTGVGARAQSESPNEKLNIAVIGCGGHGWGNLERVSRENIVALCDVNDRKTSKAYEKFPKAKRYRDFRKMLTEMDRQIDAVMINTPDHNHAPIGLMAMKMGKHCFCEKLLTHNFFEARLMAELSKEKKLATQMGTQCHASTGHRRAVELVQSGAIGQVAEVHTWHTLSYSSIPRPEERPPVPPELDWDLWLGPAPYRPYHPCYLTPGPPGGWRWWWDFGNGMLGDHGVHLIDLPFGVLGLRYPTNVEAVGPPVNEDSTPPWLTVRWEFPARGNAPPVKLTWYHGPEPPSARLPSVTLPSVVGQADMRDVLKEISSRWNNILFVGQKGLLMANAFGCRLLPAAKFAHLQEAPIPTSAFSVDTIGHYQEWIAACKTGSETSCNFDYSGALTESLLLGIVAYRVAKPLQWDSVKLKATNCPEADRYLRREYRKGWEL
jgi:predicted dehydrogenase